MITNLTCKANIAAQDTTYPTYIGLDCDLHVNRASSVIDIGSPAIDREHGLGGDGSTVIFQDNPANATGIIISIEIWASIQLTGVKIATFYKVIGTNFSTRDTETIGTVTAGSKQTIPVSLNVVTGDYIGIHWDTGSIESDWSGGSAYWYSDPAADLIPCINQEFIDIVDDDLISLYGTSNITYLNFKGVDLDCDLTILEGLVQACMSANQRIRI
jgi:hypothetical protein